LNRPAFELLETMRWTPADGWYLLDRHLARLEQSARHFQFKHWPGQIRAALEGAVEHAVGPLRVRLLVAEDGAARAEHAPLDLGERTLQVKVAAHPIDPTDIFLYHKTTKRDVYERARRPDCDDVVLWNPEGEITETTIANLVVEMDGQRVTPPVRCGLLPGTLRAELLASGEVIEAPVTKPQLISAARFWLVNSVRGWCPGLLSH
jgi:para-aminobenzoate synthetase/4-amino-4-deoxychorismate lyase